MENYLDKIVERKREEVERIIGETKETFRHRIFIITSNKCLSDIKRIILSNLKISSFQKRYPPMDGPV